jgi:hypothetical protein
VFAASPEGLSEFPDGVSFTTQLHVSTVGSLGRAAVLVAIKTRYPDVAPDTAVQLRLTGRDTLLAPLPGDTSVGAGRFAASASDAGRKAAASRNHLLRIEVGDGAIRTSERLSTQTGRVACGIRTRFSGLFGRL